MNASSNEKRVLIIGADGLRPDVLQAGPMPTYKELMAKGTVFTGFRSTFPSQTRVNMTTLATGVLPSKHGIVNNRMCVRTSRGLRFINTGDAEQLRELEGVDGEKPVLAPTLGDRLHSLGSALSVVASSSPGASYLWNPSHVENVLNARTHYGHPGLVKEHERLGRPGREAGKTKYNMTEWATTALIHKLATDRSSRAFTLWLTEPDSSQHYYGLGSPEALRALSVVDDCVARVVEALERLDRADEFEILFVSDHGHSSVLPMGSLSDHLGRAAEELGIGGFIAVGDFVYPAEVTWDDGALGKLIDWLARQSWCDVVFANGELVPPHDATVPLELAIGQIRHGRAPLVAVSPRWDGEPNDFAVPGRTSTMTEVEGLFSSHGTASPFDMGAVCFGVGASFAQGERVDAPCSTVDVAPTVWELLGFDEPSSLYGFDGGSLLQRTSEEYQVERVLSVDGVSGVDVARVGARTYLLGSAGLRRN